MLMAGTSTPKTSPPDTLRFHIVPCLPCLLAGICGGWIIWGGAVKALPSQQKKAVQERQIVPLKHADPNALPMAPSIPEGMTASQTKCFQALSIIDPDFRFAEFMAALKEMQPGDASAMFKKFKEEYRPEKTPNREWEAFLHRWGEIDPTESLAYALKRDTANAQGYFLKHFLEGWARVDDAAAVRWLNEHPDIPEWEGAFAGLLRGKASRDPQGATRTALTSIPEDASANWLRDNTAAYLAAAILRRGGGDELRNWFANIPTQTKTEAKFKERAMQAVAHHLDSLDSKVARQWLLAQPIEAWHSEAAYQLIAKKWGKGEPGAALTWLAALAAGKIPMRPAAGKEIYQDWSDVKPDEAEQWTKSVSDQSFLQFIGAVKAPPRSRGATAPNGVRGEGTPPP